MMRFGLSQIVSSMRHRKAAYSSLVLEVALGCTVVAYALGLGRSLREQSDQPLGFELERTFTASFEARVAAGWTQRSAEEQAELRALPGVEVAAWVDLPPLSRSELPESIQTARGTLLVWTLRGDPDLARALGAQLTAGRWLTVRDGEPGGPKPVLATPGLARRLGPGAIGSTLSSTSGGSLTIVGVIDRDLRLGPFYPTGTELLVTAEAPMATRRTNYVIRTSAAASRGFLGRAYAQLEQRPERIVRLESLVELRRQFVRNVGGAESIILITVLGMVLVVLVGSIGMASSLIVERRRQIGIRRALGARRSDIVGYFMMENLLATVLGVAVGAGCCVLLDQFVMSMRGSPAIAWPDFLPLAAALFVVAGQVSVWIPAQRAACGAPCIVARVG